MAQGIFYSIGLNPSNYLAGAARVQGATNNMKSAVTGLAGKVMSLTNVFTLAGQAMRLLQAARAPFMLAADMEKTEVGMNTIIKNLQVTRGLIAELRSLGAQTPLELPELTGSARSMLGAGWKLGDVVRDLKMFGDVAAGAQTDLNGLVQVMTQVKGKGRLMADDMMQFSERGVAGLRDALAQAKNIGTEDVAKAMERGEVSLKDLMTAFQRMTGQGGIYFKAMENQSHTTHGLISTLKDKVNEVLLAFTQPINDAIKPFLERSIELTERLAMKARAAIGAFRLILGDGGQGLREALGWLFNPALWKAIGNYLSLALQTAASRFIAAIISGLREVNSVLPRFMRADDQVLEYKEHAAASRADRYGAAMTHQGMVLGDAFTKGFTKAQKVWLDATTAARINYNNQLIKEKDALKQATQATGNWVQSIAQGMKQAVDYVKGMTGVASKASGGSPADGSEESRYDEDGRRKSDGRRRIRGWSRERQLKPRPSALDWLKAGGPGRKQGGLSPENNPNNGPSPLDYLRGKGLTPPGSLHTRTLSQRERTVGQVKGEPEVLRILERIAKNTEMMKVL
ncbi:hypothetical protein AYO49_05645 [Verrucomicrobiaceae bacterium SCGC AG-212-N21]|nr:hypothetical protein AYO49_05645 [Verrucomicrobiaceae bacterium SCGC AG-212-N21]